MAPGFFVRLLATWFYLGRLNLGPGTWGTLGALPLAVFFVWVGPYWHLSGAVIFTLVAIVVATAYEAMSQDHDPKEVVIDEVAGFLVATAWLPLTWESFVAAFLLFRALDIFKPFPIRWLDENVKGGAGVVADDVAAGIVTNLILQTIYRHTTLLGEQLQL